jgi:RluA family pseudouridine synthase
MPKPGSIELRTGPAIPILYEDQAVLAIDKPSGWLLAPLGWDRTRRNLQRALESAIGAGDYWARSRNLRYLRFIHRLDADTSGVLLLAKSPGALTRFSQLFANRAVDKRYWAVVTGHPRQPHWICRLKLAAFSPETGKVKVDARHGKEAETEFQVLQIGTGVSLIEARPRTGRTHQIRVHLAAAGCPVLNDPIYGTLNTTSGEGESELALRAVALSYFDPFRRRQVRIRASTDEFLKRFGFDPVKPETI